MLWFIFIAVVLLVFGVLSALPDLDVSYLDFLQSDVIQTDVAFWCLTAVCVVFALLFQIFWQKSKTATGLIRFGYLSAFIVIAFGLLGLFAAQALIVYGNFYQQIPKESYTVTATVRVLEISDSVYDEKLGTNYRQKAIISDLKLVDNTHQYAKNATNDTNPFYITDERQQKNIKLPQQLTVLLTANAPKNQSLKRKNDNLDFNALNKLTPNSQTKMTLVVSPISKQISASGFDGYRWLATRHIHANAQVLKMDDDVVLAGESGIHVYLQTLRQTLRNHFYQDWHELLEDKRQAKAVTLSLLTGDRALINKNTKDLYQASGISHLLAISGTHVVFLAICLAFLVIFIVNTYFYRLYLVISARALRLSVMIGASLIYAMFTGFDVPAVRTVYMLIALAIASRLAMAFAAHQILAITALVMIWLDPLVVWQAGFWLSFVAVLLLMRYENNTVIGDKKSLNIKQQAMDLLKLQTWLFITMLPISVLLFGKVSLWGLLVNLFAVGLFGMVIVPINLLAGVIYAIIPPLATWFWGVSAWILGLFHGLIAYLTALNQDVWIYHQLGNVAIIFGVLAIMPFVIPIFSRRLSLLAVLALVMMVINKPQQISQLDIVVLPSDDAGISQILLRQNNADSASVNGQAVWLFVADYSGRMNHHHGKILLENLKKQGITHLTGVVVQTPNSQLMQMMDEINQSIPIHRYWQAGIVQNQSKLAMSACIDGQIWQGLGLEVLAITGWQQINNQAVWGCSIKIVSNQKPTIKNALSIRDNVNKKQSYQVIINGATDKLSWQLFEKICPSADAKNSINATDVWLTHTQSPMTPEAFGLANPAGVFFTDKSTTQNHQKAEQIIAEVTP